MACFCRWPLASGKISPTLVARNIITATGGTFRVVFRVKTNRGNDDEDFGDGKTLGSKFSSLTRGAAVIDNVSLTQGGGANLVRFGDFESASSIDNNLGTATTARVEDDRQAAGRLRPRPHDQSGHHRRGAVERPVQPARPGGSSLHEPPVQHGQQRADRRRPRQCGEAGR